MNDKLIKKVINSMSNPTSKENFQREELIEALYNGEGVWTVPESTKPQQLYDTVIQFMKDQDVTCEETIHQCDRVIENAYDFISDLFNIVKDDLNLEEDEYSYKQGDEILYENKRGIVQFQEEDSVIVKFENEVSSEYLSIKIGSVQNLEEDE